MGFPKQFYYDDGYTHTERSKILLLDEISIRRHIENKLHWILDVVFNEDNNKIYNKNEEKILL